MMQDTNENRRNRELAAKWLNKTITAAEEQEFAAWYNANQGDPLKIPPDFAANEKSHKNRMFSAIMRSVKADPKVNQTIPIYLRYLTAAIILLALSITAFVYFNNLRKQNIAVRPAKYHTLKNDILPGGNKAILTLANGTHIALNTAKTGVLASQGNTVLNKGVNNVLVYHASKLNGQSSDKITYNTITTPKGGEFQIILPDGSKVWLNAASSITFPTAFSGRERDVSTTGEVYFEVAKNKAMPFKVTSGRQTVEVLGTHFNINAYGDEPHIKTTLAEGSVKIREANQTVLLKPSQQAVIAADGSGGIKVKEVDTEEALAWTTGVFQFERADIELIMRKASRWYDVSIDYEGKIPAKTFTGSISRKVNLSELLNMLKYTGVNFKIQGKTIVVTP